jgi:hypothetical protein
VSEQLAHDLTVHHVSPDAVREYPGNARRGDVDAIADSMDENGVFAPIVVQRSTGYVLDGNHRLKAMLQLGEDTVPVIYVDVDDERAKRIVLVANRTNDLATYDEQALVDLLQDLPDLSGTGYDDDDLADLLVGLDVHLEDASPDVKPTGKDRYGEEGEREYDNDSRVPTAESYANAANRMMILNYPLERFAWMQEKLEELSERDGYESNSDAVLRLVEDATGETAPAAPSDDAADDEDDDSDEEGAE